MHLLLLALTLSAPAATLDVPGAFLTVQDAIDAALPGDTVQVAAGTTSGEVLVDKDITIAGSGMDQTTLDGGAGEYVLTVAAGASVTLQGFTVDAGGLRYGVNVLPGAHVTISSVKIKNGRSDFRWGVGLRVESAMLEMSRSIVCANTGDSAEDTIHGAVYVIEGTSFTASESVFFDNSMDSQGGAVYVKGNAVFTNNAFLRNVSTNGAAVFVVDAGTLQFTNNLVVSHVAAAGPGTTEFVVRDANGTISGGNNLYYDNLDDHTDTPLPNDLFDVDPLLRNPTVSCADATLADFSLLPGSPAIGAGDPTGLFDDIGAVEFVDLDDDGYPAGFEDCDDNEPTVNPDGVDLIGTGIDEDCDGAELCFVDADNDGHRSSTYATTPASDGTCTAPGEALATAPLDCYDNDPALAPSFPEFPCDGIDNDCDPLTPDDNGACDTGTVTDTDTDTDTDVDTDTDTDVDTDTDTDTDVDTDTDADTDTDTDTDPTPTDTGLLAVSGGTAIDGCGCRAATSAPDPLRPWARRRR